MWEGNRGIVFHPRYYKKDRELLHDPSPFTPEKKNLFPLYRTLGGTQSRSPRFGGDKTFSHIPEIEPLMVQPVT
jgi:hypothetical protein